MPQAGIEPSVGSVGDSYDNALAETINGLFKAEVIHRRGPWRSFETVEYATLEWAQPDKGPRPRSGKGWPAQGDWFNHRRLLEPIGNVPPAEAEAAFYAALEAISDGGVSSKPISLRETRGGSALLVPPSTVTEMPHPRAVWPAAMLTTAAGALEADHGRQLRPVDGVQVAELRADRHQAVSCACSAATRRLTLAMVVMLQPRTSLFA